MMNNKNIVKRKLYAAIAGMILTMMLTACGGGGGGDLLPISAPATLKSIAVTSSTPSIAPSTTAQFTAWGTYSNGIIRNLSTSATWTSSDTNIAEISASGLATAHTLTGSTVIAAVFSGLTGSATLTTSEVVSLSLSPATPPHIAPGMTQQFSASGTLANSAVQNLTSFATWGSSNLDIATVSTAGLASAVAAPGTTTISAMFGGITDSATLTTSALENISTSPSITSIAKGTSKQFSASGTLADSTLHDLTTLATWSSSNTAVATVNNLAGPKGLVSSHATGTTFITAAFGSIVSSPVSTLVVTPAILTSITISPTIKSLALGKDQQYSAIGTFSDGSHQDVTATVTWHSSNTTVATISSAAGSKGLASSHAEGTTTITSSSSGVTSNSATLTVTPKELVSIAVTPSSAHILCMGTPPQFTAMGTYTDGTFLDLTNTATWISSDTNITTTVNKGIVTVLACSIGGSTNISAEVSGVTSNVATLTVTFF